MYVSDRVDIFDMVDIDLFTVFALNMMVLKLGYTGKSKPMFYNYLRSLTSLDEGLYALACEKDVRCLATLVRSFKLIEAYIEHSVTALESYLTAPRFRAALEEITDDPGSIETNRTEKMLLLTWHESSETTKEPVCDFVTPSSLPQHDSSTPCKDSICESITPRCMPDCILTPPIDEPVITYTQLSGVQGVDTQIHVIDDVMRQLSFDEKELDGEACFADVVWSGVDSSGLIHDESFGFDDLDLKLNEPVNLNVSQVKTQSELPMSEEPDVSRTQEPILAEVSTQEPIVAEVSTQEPIVAEVSIEVPIVEEVGTQEFSVKDVVIEDYVSSREDADQYNGTYDDDDVDEYFLVDKENEVVEPDVDVHLFGISMDLPFDNIGVTNLVSDDVLEGDDADVINADGFDSEPEAKDRVCLHSIESRRNFKLYKNNGVSIRARCDGKVPVFTMSQGTGPTGPNRGMEARPSGSSGPTTRSKKRKNTGTNDDNQASSSILDVHDKGYLCPWVLEIKHCTYKFLSEKIFEQVRVNPDITVKAVQHQLQHELEVQISISKAFKAKAKAEREIRGDHCLGDDINLHPNSNITFISDRQKRAASATNVRDFKKCMLELKTMNPKDQVLGEVHMSNNTFATQASCPRKEEPLHVNPTETLDTIRQHEKDKVERWQQCVGVVICLFAAGGEGGAGGPGVAMSETRNADGREMGDGVPTQSSVAGGESEWSFL
ncbi:hypothetical protein Tco_0013483 [Tanacetum coccineum]